MSESPSPIYHVNVVGEVRPPDGDGLMRAARVELSEEGFARLMEITSGQAPTPAQLCREVDFERDGAYRQPDVPSARVLQVQREGYLIAAARLELSDAGFKQLMHSIDWRGPTPAELVAAVEAERAKGITPH